MKRESEQAADDTDLCKSDFHRSALSAVGFGFRPFAGAFVFGDRLGLGDERVAKRPEHLQKKIQLSQTLTPSANRPEKKLELNTPSTISNRQHVMAPLVLTTATRFHFREYVRSVASRNRREKHSFSKKEFVHVRYNSIIEIF